MRIQSPIRANTICASTSAVTSTTSEAVASGQETPNSVIDRAPRTKPPTGEKGRQVVAESRTIRPQKNTPSAMSGRPAMFPQASASTAKSRSCQAISRPKPPQPTESRASTTWPKPNQPTSTVPAARPRAASAIDSFFNGEGPSDEVGDRLYTNPASPGYSGAVQTLNAPTLVTGATGFVGSAVARALVARGHAVRLLARPASDRRNLAGLAAEVVEGDLTDAASLAPAVAGCRYLFHVAADYRIWVPDPEAMIRANVGGTVALMQAAQAAGVERIVYCSSVAALGLTKDGTPARETTPVTEEAIVGLYKKSKYRAEQAVLDMVATKGLPAVIVNPSTPVGPRDIKPTPTGKMIADAASGRMPAYLDTGLNVVHVDDVAEGHVLALERGVVGEKYILGG